MQMAWSAKRTCRLSRSASEYTATVPIPNSLQAQMTRRAISPRLAMRIFLKGADAKQSLPVLDRLAVGDQLARHHSGDFGLDFVHELHRFDDAEHRARLHRLAHTHERRRARRGAFVESPHDRRFDEVFVIRCSRRRRRRGRRGRLGGSRRWRGNGRLNLTGGEAHVMGFPLCPANAYTVVSPLHLQLGDTTLVHDLNQFTNLFNCHGISYSSRNSLDVGVRTSHPVFVTTTVSSMRTPPNPSR